MRRVSTALVLAALVVGVWTSQAAAGTDVCVANQGFYMSTGQGSLCEADEQSIAIAAGGSLAAAFDGGVAIGVENGFAVALNQSSAVAVMSPGFLFFPGALSVDPGGAAVSVADSFAWSFGDCLGVAVAGEFVLCA